VLAASAPADPSMMPNCKDGRFLSSLLGVGRAFGVPYVNDGKEGRRLRPQRSGGRISRRQEIGKHANHTPPTARPTRVTGRSGLGA